MAFPIPDTSAFQLEGQAPNSLSTPEAALQIIFHPGSTDYTVDMALAWLRQSSFDDLASASERITPYLSLNHAHLARVIQILPENWLLGLRTENNLSLFQQYALNHNHVGLRAMLARLPHEPDALREKTTEDNTLLHLISIDSKNHRTQTIQETLGIIESLLTDEMQGAQNNHGLTYQDYLEAYHPQLAPRTGEA